MYRFVNTTELQSGRELPSEALKLNGEYIEDQIEGYRTLYVSGREALMPELSTYEIGTRDGSKCFGRRYPSRVIVVGYQLTASSNEAFRKAFNCLNSILNVEDAELIFNDEPDKFFTGTPSAMADIEPGRNAVTGEIEFLCLDPFKYSIEEYEVVPSIDQGLGFLVDYRGTYKSYPTLEAEFYHEEETGEDGESEQELTGNGDCGYVAFFNGNGKIIQLGDPEEADTESYAKSQTLVNKTFVKSTSWGASSKALWKTNSGITSANTVVQSGAMGLAHSYNTTAPDTFYLKAANYGTGPNYHGPSITRILPADKSGHIGAANFTLTYKQKMCIGDEKNDTVQRGLFQVLLVSGSGASRRIAAGVSIYKGSTGKTAKLRFFVNNKKVETIEIDLSYHNKYFGANRAENKKKKIKAITTVKSSSITRSGSKITFNIGGIKRTFLDDAAADTEVKEITFTLSKYADKAPLAYNGIYWAKFVKNNCETWADIPNKFSANDIVTADCKDGEIYLNDSRAPELGALGNDWEDFTLDPGQNQIGIAYSEWVEDNCAPQFKMKYREVYL